MQKKSILFICIENAGRSQMAEGFARYYGANEIEAYSAGSKPGGKVNPLVITVMHEKNIDLSHHFPKGFAQLPQKNFDYVITLGCGDVCPFFPASRQIDWQIEDPKGKPLETIRKIRDEIEKKVLNLLEQIKQEPQNEFIP